MRRWIARFLAPEIVEELNRIEDICRRLDDAHGRIGRLTPILERVSRYESSDQLLDVSVVRA